jgi:hypothetical protein
MKTNIHTVERVLRMITGLVLMSLAFWGPNSRWFLLGVIPFATGFRGWCPLYAVFGISTCELKTSSIPPTKY